MLATYRPDWHQAYQDYGMTLHTNHFIPVLYLLTFLGTKG